MLGFRAQSSYNVFRMYGIIILNNQIRALKFTPGYIGHTSFSIQIRVISMSLDTFFRAA